MTLEPPKIAQPIDMVLPVRFAGPVRSAPRIRNCTAPGPACQTGHQATGAALEGPVAISITLPERMSQSPKSIVMFYTYFYMLYVVIYIYMRVCVCVYLQVYRMQVCLAVATLPGCAGITSTQVWKPFLRCQRKGTTTHTNTLNILKHD